MVFSIQANPKVKFKKSEKGDEYLDLARELKIETMEHEGDSDTICNWCAWYSHQRIGKGTGRLGDKRTRGDHPNYSIIKISQNTERSPGYLRRLSVP